MVQALAIAPLTVYQWDQAFGVDTSEAPGGTVNDVAFSNDGRFLAVAHSSSPYVSVYHWDGINIGAKIADPVDLPPGAANCVYFTSGQSRIYLCVGHDASPYVTMYTWEDFFAYKITSPTLPGGVQDIVLLNGITGDADIFFAHKTTPYITGYNVEYYNDIIVTKMTDPATLPTGDAYGVALSSSDYDGIYLAVAHSTSPYLTVYDISGGSSPRTYVSKLADPATLPAGDGKGIAFSVDGKYLAVAHLSSPYVTVYSFVGDFTAHPWTATIGAKIADPATLPTGDGYAVEFSPDGRSIAVAHTTSPYVSAYPWTGAFGTILADPATLPASDGKRLSFIETRDKMSALSRTMLWGPRVGFNSGPFYGKNTQRSIYTMSANTDWCSIVFMAPKTGNINTLRFAVDAQSGTQDMRAGIVEINTGTGVPTTTDVGAPGTFNPGPNYVQEVTLVTPAPVVRGSCYAIKIWPDSVSSGSVGIVHGIQLLPDASIYGSSPTGWEISELPYPVYWNGFSPIFAQIFPAIGARYDDGDWLLSNLGKDITQPTYAAGVKVGSLFSLPLEVGTVNVFGAILAVQAGPSVAAATDTWTVTLYDALDNVLTQSTVINGIFKTGVSDGDPPGVLLQVYFPDDVTIDADIDYRIVVEHDSASSLEMCNYIDLEINEMRDAFPWSDGSRWIFTAGGPGSWSFENTFMPAVAIWIRVNVGQ